MIYFLGSVGLIVVAIVFTAVLQRSQGNTSSREDIRARAGNPSSLQMNARVVSVDSARGVVIVDNLQMADGTGQNLGQWTVTVASNVNISKLVSGRNVLLGVDAPTFAIQTHTFTALEIRQVR